MSSLRNVKKYIQAVRQNKGILDTDQLQIEARAAVPTDANLALGRVVYVTGTGLRIYAESGWFTVPISSESGGGVSWDNIYDNDKTLTIDDTTLTFAGSHATNDAFTVKQGSSSTGAAIQITHAKATENDIRGTAGSWQVMMEGYATFTRIDLGDDQAIRFGAVPDATIQWVNGSSFLDIAGATNFDGNMIIEAGHDLTCSGTAGSDVITVTAGDIVGSDTSLTLTDGDDNASALSVTSSAATDFGNAADNGVVEFICDSLTSGTLLHLSVTEGTLSGGHYLVCWDETADAAVLTVGENGALTITGSAEGTDAIVITDGDITVTDGDIEVTAGFVKIAEDATDKTVLDIDTAGISVAAVTINADALTGTEAAIDLSVDALVDGVGIKIENVGEALTSGELLQILNTESGSLASKTGNVASITSSLTETGDNRTAAYDTVLISRSDIINHVGGTLTSTGSTLKILHTTTDTAGTSADSSVVLEVEAADGGTGAPTGDVVLVTSVGVGAQAMSIVAAGVGADDVHIAGSGAHTSGKAVLNVTASGNIATGGNIVRVDGGAIDANGGAIFVEFDFAGLANTNEPTGVKIDGGGKKLQALIVDADPVANSVALFHSDAVIADDKGVIEVSANGNIADGSAALRIALTGAPAATAYAMEIDLTGVTATNDPGAILINGVGDDVRGIYIDVDNTDIHAVSIDGTGNLNAGNMLRVDNDGVPAANTDAVADIRFTGTATNNPRILNIYGTGKDVQGIILDTDNTTTNAVGISGTGALSGGHMLSVTSDGTIAANTDAVVQFSFTGTATNDPILLQLDHNAIGPVIDIDQDGNDGTDPAVGIRINTDNAGAGNQIALDIDQVDESKSYFARFNATTGWTSTKSPETDAETGFIKIMVGSTAYFIPYYGA